MKNIKQYTNLSPATIEENVEVSIKTPTGNKTFFIDYKVITIENTKIIKLGYCCGDGLF